MRINNGNIRGGQTKLSQIINVSQPTIARWFAGLIEPTAENISNLAEAFGVSEKEVRDAFDEIRHQKRLEGTLLGSGNIYRKKTINTPAISSDDATWLKNAIPLTSSNTIQLPILADVPAGLPEYSDRDVEMFVDIPRFIFPGADFVVKCIGDSLEPKIHKGDFCVIRKMTEPLDGRAMLIKSESGVCMKVVRKEKDAIKLCSTNPKYKPFTPKELTVIGLIIGHWSRDDKEHWQ